MPPERLQKILARAGVASRRAAEELIRQGQVAVDGRVVREPGTKADPQTQRITVKGQPLPQPEPHQYWLLHKPAGVVSTARDPQGRPQVLDLLPPQARGRLFPVGRLDRDSEGLILLTNHGELAHRLTHPSFQVPKHYRVWVKGHPSRQAIARLRQGLELDDGPTAPARVYLKAASPRQSKLSFVIHEGRKRIIRRMCQAVGHPVLRLVRVGLGPLRLGDLPPGAARALSDQEVRQLLQAAGLLTSCKERPHGVNKATRPAAGRGRSRRPRHKGR